MRPTERFSVRKIQSRHRLPQSLAAHREQSRMMRRFLFILMQRAAISIRTQERE